jgi:superfamily I DNA and/or RNA helicase/predicted DNA-binding WGR domain protein
MAQISFRQFLPAAFDKGSYATDDVIDVVMPLFEKVLRLHEEDLVAPFQNEKSLFVENNKLDINETLALGPSSAFRNATQSAEELITEGYNCFEEKAGLHDAQTDIYSLGKVLGSIALGLNLYEAPDAKIFEMHRRNPLHLNERLHPTVAMLITEMTEPDRSNRMQDLYEIIQRLKSYRDYDPEMQMDLSNVPGWISRKLDERSQLILSKLRNRLFDTSRRNRLLYFKPNLRFANLTVGSVPMVLNPEAIQPEKLFTYNSAAQKIAGMKEILLNKFLPLEDHPYLPAALDKIRLEDQRNQNEYGFSQLKLVIAFLHWNNLKEDAEESVESPLLLIPVRIKKAKSLKEDHYILEVKDNNAEVNPVLANELNELYGIKLPDFIDLEDTDPEAFYLQLKAQIEGANQGVKLKLIDKPPVTVLYKKAKQAIINYNKRLNKGGEKLSPFQQDLINAAEEEITNDAEITGSPYSWDFDTCNMVLGNFNYKKMSLVRDYNHVIDHKIEHKVFEELFSNQPRKIRPEEVNTNDAKDWNHVITADPTQAKAILQSRTGESYIIQGPPGTGKSQTITNLIADFAARGKNVLFVCEKRAALDVVYHRLKQNGLDELCCYIHDSRADKREFIKDLKATYEDFIKNRMDLHSIKLKRTILFQTLEEQVKLLNTFHSSSVETTAEAGIPLKDIMSRIIELKDQLIALKPAEKELLPQYKEWLSFGEAITALSTALEKSGAEPAFSEHPFAQLNDAIFTNDNPVNLLERLVQHSKTLLNEVSNAVAAGNISPEFSARLEQIKELVQDAVLLEPLAESDNLQLVNKSNKEAKKLDGEIKDYNQKKAAQEKAITQNKSWRNKFTVQDIENALPVAEKNEGSFFSFLSRSWRRLKKQVNESYDFSQHQMKPTYTAVLQQLKAEYDATDNVQRTKQDLQQEYKLDNIDTTYLGIEVLRNKQGDKEIDYLLSHPEANELVKKLYRLNNILHQLEVQLKKILKGFEIKSLTELNDELENIAANAESLQELLPALKEYAILPAALKNMLSSIPLTPVQAEAAMAQKTVEQYYLQHRTFADIDMQAIEKAVQTIRHCYKELLKLNAQFIRANIRSEFLAHIDLSNTAPSQLNAEQKLFKKNYNEGRKILENEFGKSMRYKSIRELTAKESGLVLKDIKPVWLMSPLSVSDSLPLDPHFFDVVIFDEASQITLEEGIPSLYRSPQTIIVGDDKQMPPTNFFTAKAEDPDDLEAFGDEGGAELLSTDADSLLVQGARKLDSTMLSWHYRSRYETLISYSNHAFYEANLLTIPDRTIHQKERPAIEVTKPEDAMRYADALFDRSISFHFLSDSVYEQRSNSDEANYIARLVRELLKRRVKESIGIVAFSREQQGTIEEALTQLADIDKEFELLLEEAYTRTEDEQFTGLIIKNLENIQGDERDIIILSVCYGFDAKKKMLMNFGPVNKKGGEKRLNVIFSRAKKHMAVISSIKYNNITNEYNEGANYFRRFLHYAESVSTGNMQMARSILDGLVINKHKADQPKAMHIVVKEIKEQLLENGYESESQIGQSDFKASLAVKARKDDADYTLSILIDDDKHYSNNNLVEQYYQRPDILRSFGWRTMHVFTKDWLHDPKKVMRQILERIKEEPPENPSPETLEENFLLPNAATENAQITMPENTEAKLFIATNAPTGYDHLPFARLTFTDSNSSTNKFWEAATDDEKLVVRYGRVGGKGQLQVKTFADRNAAEKERQKLIREKENKGYRR